MKKIKIHLCDKDYKNAFIKFLDYYPELKANIDLIKSQKGLESLDGYTIISDAKKISNQVKENNTVYRLSANSINAKNEIYKYGNVKQILSTLIDNVDYDEVSNYHIYTISSPSEGSGKTLIANTMAEIISKKANCALIKMIDEDAIDSELSLSELILMSIKNKDKMDSLALNEKGFYPITGFRLIRDYVEMDIKNLQTLLKYLNKKMQIDFFIIELPSSLDRTTEEICKLSKINFIINDNRRAKQVSKLEYLLELGEKAWENIVIENFSDNARNDNELPTLRKYKNYESMDAELEEEFLEKDYLLFKHKLSQIMGAHYA